MSRKHGSRNRNLVHFPRLPAATALSKWTPKASSLSTDTSERTVEVGMKDTITVRQRESSVYRKVVIFESFHTHRHVHLQVTLAPTKCIWNLIVLCLIPRFAC